MLDIVISALNEEHFIGDLLQSLAKQTYKDFIVYLSDGNSDDKTVAVAKEYAQQFPLQILISKKRGLAHQRNVGGFAGKESHILFLDADIILPPYFLASLLRQAKQKELINCWISPLSQKPIDKIMFLTYNLLALEVVRYFWPVGMGGCLYTKRSIFEDLKGFDETLSFWEDVDFIKRAIDNGAHFTIVRRPLVYLSTRRFEVEGRINYITQMLKGTIYALRTGQIPSSAQMSYPMGINYEKLSKRKKFSKRRLTALLRSYIIYRDLFLKIYSVSVDTVNPHINVNQVLFIPLVRQHKKKIKRLWKIINREKRVILR